MSFKHPAIALAAAAFCVAAASAPASAQSPNCGEIYNRLMGLYQVAPQSPEYAEMSAVYSANCLGGPSAGPAYQGPYPAPGPYYQQPAPVDPGAAVVGGIIGGVIGGALEGDRGHRREGDRRPGRDDDRRRGRDDDRR